MQASVIAEKYGLPKDVAAEIISEELRAALLRRWEAWAWLVISLGLATGLFFFGSRHATAVFVLAGSLMLWVAIGRSMSAKAVHRAAAEKASRLSRSNA
jgi:hypothetical protein